MGTDKKRVLIVAYACEPDKTSEPGVGWHFSREISKSYEVIVLTRKNNQKSIESQEADSRSFIYYDLPGIFKLLKRTLPLGTQLYYGLWQWGAYLHAKKFMKKSGLQIDLVHHLNFGVSWIAPPAYLLKQPFVWGPIGGGDTVPWSFLKKMKLRWIAQEIVYGTINRIGKVSPFSLITRIKVAAVVFRTQSAKLLFPKRGNTHSAIISETASSEIVARQSKTMGNTVHAICVGRMNYWKGFILAVQGFHEFLKQGGQGTLELFGEGTELQSIANYIKANKLEGHIFIRGFVPNETIKQKMDEAQIMLHPSFREGGSWAIMEAMSFGIPVICLNTSGPKDMVTENCGMLIQMKSSEQVSADIGNALNTLFKEKSVYEKLSKNAITRIKEEYNWTRRGEQIGAIYEKVLDDH